MPCWHLRVMWVSAAREGLWYMLLLSLAEAHSSVILLPNHDIHACVSIAHWKAVLPAIRQHKLQTACKYVGL